MEVAQPENRVHASSAKRAWQAVLSWQYLGLTAMVVVTVFLHFVAIMQPAEPVFDEQHYVKNAQAIIAGQGDQRPEHPPLGKLFVVAGIRIFGDNPVGWRFFPIVFGTASIVLFYFICRRLRMPRQATFFATFLLAFENLTFLQASIAMLDVFSLTFMLAAFLLYLNNRYMASSLGIALSALAKLLGALGLVAIIIHWLFTGRQNPKRFIASVLLSGVLFLALMPVFDWLILPQFQNPISQTLNMLNLSGSLTFANTTHDAMSRPWVWLVPLQGMWYWYDPHYLAVINVTVSAFIGPAIVYMVIRANKGNSASIFGLAWFVATYVVWIPMTFLTDRISFLFYFYPTIGAVCIGIGLRLSQLGEWLKTRPVRQKKAITGAIVTYLAVHFAFLVLFAPFNNWVNWYQILVAPH